MDVSRPMECFTRRPRHATGASAAHRCVPAGGSNTTPEWTRVDGTQDTCGSCHGAPPPAPHPADTACEKCHSATVGPNMTILHPERHIDGVVQLPPVPTRPLLTRPSQLLSTPLQISVAPGLIVLSVSSQSTLEP